MVTRKSSQALAASSSHPRLGQAQHAPVRLQASRRPGDWVAHSSLGVGLSGKRQDPSGGAPRSSATGEVTWAKKATFLGFGFSCCHSRRESAVGIFLLLQSSHGCPILRAAVARRVGDRECELRNRRHPGEPRAEARGTKDPCIYLWLKSLLSSRPKAARKAFLLMVWERRAEPNAAIPSKNGCS